MARVMEKTWERIQQKTFTGWVNNHLKKVGLKVDDLATDLADGLKLIALCEVISGETFPSRYEKKPNHRIKMVGNISVCLQWLGTKGIKLTGIGGEDICDGNIKLILGLIWTIILRFQIQDISMEDLSAKEALLLWCKRKAGQGTEYNLPIDNFHKSWQDGLAFCALIHKHRPDLLDYNSLDPKDKVGNLQKAFEVAERELGVPQLLDAQDIVDLEKPDERSIITYVSLYYHVFSSSQLAEMAGKRVQKLIDFNESVQRMKDEYANRASALREWIDAKNAEFQARDFPDSLEGVQAKMSELKQFKQGEKNDKSNEKTALEAHYNALQTKLSVNKRPAYVPPEGLAPNDLDNAWDGMDGSEREYSAALLAEYRRQKKIRDLLRRFNQKLGKLESWISEKIESMGDQDLGNTVSACRAKLRTHEGFEQELETQGSREKVLAGIYDELVAIGFADVASLDAKLAAKNEHKDELVNAADARKQALEAELARLQALEDQLLDYSRRAMALRQWADDADDTLNDPITVESVQGVQELQAEFEEVVNATGEKESEMEALRELVQALANAGFKETLFSPTSLADLERIWAAHGENVNQRRAALEEENARQEQHEELRKQFAGAADAFASATRSNTDAVNNASGSAEEQLAAVKAVTAQFGGMKQQYEALVQMTQTMEAEAITDNPHTPHTIESLRAAWNALSTLATEKQKAISAEVSKASQKSQLPPELQAEYSECFAHFDKDKDGTLNRLELGGCLKSLGMDHLVGDMAQEGGPLDSLLAQLAQTHEGAVTFDEFLAFMEKSTADAETPDAVREAFSTICGGKAFITEDELRAVLPGDKVDHLIKVMPAHPDGGYDYVAYCAEGGAAFS